jgi:hypothetical protein
MNSSSSTCRGQLESTSKEKRERSGPRRKFSAVPPFTAPVGSICATATFEIVWIIRSRISPLAPLVLVRRRRSDWRFGGGLSNTREPLKF